MLLLLHVIIPCFTAYMRGCFLVSTLVCTSIPTSFKKCFTLICILHVECHAELNAIISGCRGIADLSSYKLYITHFPCNECRKLIAQSKIKKVVCDQDFDENNAVTAHLECR